MFLSLELETTVVALLTTVDLWSINSVHRLCPGHWYHARLLSAWERGSSLSVWQCSSRDHEAIDDDRKCRTPYPFIHIPWKSDNFFILLFDVIWLAPSLLTHFNWLGDLKQKLYASSWRAGPYAGGVRGVRTNHPLSRRDPRGCMRMYGAWPTCMAVASGQAVLGFKLAWLLQVIGPGTMKRNSESFTD